MKRVKNLKWFWCWKVKSGAKRETGFCSYRCFWDSEKLMCEKIFFKRANFLFMCCILKLFFQFFWLRTLVMIFFYFKLVLVAVWRFLKIYMNFMLIRIFSCILLIFGLIFAIFFYFCFVLMPQMGVEKTPITWEILS